MMRRSLPTVCLLTVLALLTAVVPTGSLTSMAQGQSALSVAPSDSFTFVENAGQFDAGARLQGHGATGTRPVAGQSSFEGEALVFYADLYGTGKNDVWAVRPDGSHLTQLTDTPTLSEVWAQLTPDGISLLTVARVNPGPSRYDHSYFLTDLMTGSTQELLPAVNLKRDRPTFSPDGQQLVFTRNRTAVDYEDSDVWRADLDGGNLFRITNTNYNNYMPQLNVDGMIVYGQAIKFAAGSTVIALIDIFGNNHSTFPQAAPGNNEGPRWSHDGSRIVFNVEGVLYSMDDDGQNVTLLATNAGGGLFSPEDAQIAFMRNGDLYLMDPDGSNQNLVLSHSANLHLVDFGELAVMTYSISGQVRAASENPIPDVTISAGAGISATTDASGIYTITRLITNTYTLTPTKPGWTFTPPTRMVSVPPDATGQDFAATVSFQLPFADDFSTEKGWINDTSGDFYRDMTNEWLSWHVYRGTNEKYYVPIQRYSGDFRLEARVKATDWNGNANLYFGLAEDLSGSFSHSYVPTGLFVDFSYYGDHSPPTTFGAHGTFPDTDRYISPVRVPYSINQWYRVVFTVQGVDWTIKVYDDAGDPVGQIADVFPATHDGFDYILLWSPDTGGEWPTGDGLFDDLVVEPLAEPAVAEESFGYGLSTMNPNDNGVHELEFNWVKVFDVPAGPQPTKVLYRVKADAFNWYNLSAFSWQVRQLAEAYGENIDAYEIGNEVNTYDEWGQSPNASRYVDVLCTARYAIHQVDPTAKIISAGLAPVGRIADEWNGHAGHDGSVQDEREYLKEFLNYNGQLCSDAIGYHPMGFRADYDAEPDVNGGTPETDCSNGFCFRGVEKIHEILQEHGVDDLRIWATEVGWIVEPADECIGHPSWQGRYWQIVSEQKQAENLVGAFKYARFHYPWMEALFVFNLDFVTAPYYDECEQMSHYSVYGRPAADALGAMSKVIRITHLPLVLRSR